MMDSRFANVFVGVLVVTAAVLAASIVTACWDGRPTVDYSTEYDLEIVNGAPESVRIFIYLSGQRFKDLATGTRIPLGSGSGIISLRSGEIRRFEMSLFGRKDSSIDNDLVRASSHIGFFEENAIAPYKSYDYPLRGCSDEVPPDSDCSDAEWVSQGHPGGTEERLFVESPDRPFYLERDSEDLDLGRVVITFVPDVDASAVDAVN